MILKHRMTFAKLMIGLVAGGVALAANAFEQTADGVFKDRIDWGVMMDMSGPASGSQLPWVNGFKDHMRQINDAGGVNGRTINLLAEDTRFDTSLDRVAWEKFVNQTPTLGVSGSGNATAQVSLVPQIRRGKLPLLAIYSMTKAAGDPPSPMLYGGFCGYNEMAQTGVGYFSDKLKLKNANVVTVHLDTAGGKEFNDYITAAAAKNGGTNKSLPMKATAADATAQVLEIINTKPDFIAVHGVPNTAILLMRALQQYGLKTPVFAIAYIGAPVVYQALGAEAGANYFFVSCFTPAGSDDSAGVKEMSAGADKYGHPALKEDINYVSGWVGAQIVAEAIKRAGPEPTREKLVATVSGTFELDTKGLSAPVKYTPDNHLGFQTLKVFSYDYAGKKFKAYGEYADYAKYVAK